MAFPYVTEENFETGTLGHFDAETDTESRLDFPHYVELARVPGLPAPYRGAYCMRVELANDGSPADAYVQETGSWDMTAGTDDLYLRLEFWVSKDITMANNDAFAIAGFFSSTATLEGASFIQYTTANGFRIGIGETAPTQFFPLILGQWNTIELFIDPAGAAGGTLDGWFNGAAFTQIASLTQADITSGFVGVVGQDAGTTAGTILFDQVVADDTRVYPISDRWSSEMVVTKTTHVAVGPCAIDNVTLVSGNGTDCTLDIYDTDIGASNDFSNRKLRLQNTAANELVDPAGVPVQCERGCFVVLGGTDPHAIIKLRRATGFGSDGAVRSWAAHRKPHPLGA